MHLLRPWALVGLVPLLAGAVYLVVYIARRTARVLPNWFDTQALRGYRPRLRAGLRVGGLALASVAALGPYATERTGPAEVLGRQVYFLLDVSASMNTPDVLPSRLEQARALLLEAADGLAGDQLGLIAFTEYAYVQCPLTDDTRAFRLFVELVGTEQFANTGTNYRAALAEGFNRLVTETNTSRRQQAQALVLLSDGEHHGPAYTSVVNRLEAAGIPVIPVGIGTYAGGRVPKVDAEGNPAGFLTDDRGLPARSQLIDTDLKALAATFGTPYLKATDSGAPAALVRALKSVPAAITQSRSEQSKHDLYAWFLLPAFLLWAASAVLIPQRKPA